ncbi:hypothetical protein [Polaribacter dokdonensis]|uniref:Uncharacterized protein n=1 Tax=Polaribacter dokdonensis DSW-5 TaxID=1300348 RepID=A0A0N0CGA7_9FLAO|nr:hypothetical protein [Polaribacter dokdonensis]KOY52997.1 hypothetical protein I602_2557 [Polaribacter dokdonensis DSW-5]SEE55713.1 hypothetical protein SAMN05444353_2332 [Polaribacter dokdonensis DSW-5]
MPRFNAYEKSLNDFSDEILIVCKNCRQKAMAKQKDKCLQIICENCGYNKRLSDVFNFPNYELWLKTELNEGKLWAYNLNHLEFIEKHIAATLRERNLERLSNISIGSRLPKWMTAKNNRAKLLKAIAKLKIK